MLLVQELVLVQVQVVGLATLQTQPRIITRLEEIMALEDSHLLELHLAQPQLVEEW
jgi:hypothetical protein